MCAVVCLCLLPVVFNDVLWIACCSLCVVRCVLFVDVRCTVVCLVYVMCCLLFAVCWLLVVVCCLLIVGKRVLFAVWRALVVV